MNPLPGRARPMPPDERRAALVNATVPLVRMHGCDITTRQIAEAAGVAEGTIFRVFPDKDSLVQAAVATAMDPMPLIAELDGIAVDLPVEERVRLATEVLQRRLTETMSLLVVLRRYAPPGHENDQRESFRRTNERIMAALVRLLEPHRDQFRYPVEEVARLLRLLAFAGSHPMFADGGPMTAGQIASVLLNGVRSSC